MGVTSFRVEAADNGFELSYCIKTVQPATLGQTYANTVYDDKKEVFMAKDAPALLKRMTQLLGIVAPDDKDYVETVKMG